MNKSRKTTKVIIAVIAAAFTFFSLSCSKEGLQAKAGAPSSTLSGEQSISVRVAESSTGEMENLISLSGEVSATGVASIMPDTNGLLSRVLVKSGDYVSAGDTIAWIDPSRPGMSYAENPVISRVSGTVTSVPAVAGNQVSTQTPIIQVGNLDRLEVDISVPEKYLAALSEGMEGRVVSRSFPDLEQSARVTEIAPVVDPRSRTVNVTLTPESTEKLRPGQAVSVNLVLEKRSQLVLVPDSAITERRDGFGVFTVTNDTALWIPVEVGSSNRGMVEIVSGLESGEEVVVAGVERITDGSTLRIVENKVG